MKHDPINSGQCCCICRHQIQLMCHPWNTKFGKGYMSQQCGWACIVEYEDKSNKGRIIFYDHEHGLCELYQQQKQKRIMKKSKSTGIRPKQIIVGAKLRLKKTPHNHPISTPSLGLVHDFIEPDFLGKVVIVREIDDPIHDNIPYDVYCESIDDYQYVGLADFDPAYGVK